MSRHGYSHGSGSDFTGAAAGGLVAMTIVLAVILAYLTFKACVYIINTYRKYAKTVPALRYSLVVFLTVSIVGCLLAFIFQRQEFFSLFSVAFLQLFLTCVVVQRQNAQTFMVQDVSIQEQVLHRKWWYDDSATLAA